MEIFRFTPDDAPRYVAIRARMLATDPWSFTSDPETDLGSDVEHLREMLAHDWYAIFGVQVDGELVAVAAIMRQQKIKHAHRCGIFGVYCEPLHRGNGYGYAVTKAAMDLAHTWEGVEFIDLGVSSGAPNAQKLYESMGFVAWGREPEATNVDGVRYDDIHMTQRIRG